MPLITLLDLSDTWVHFGLREDLARTLKVGDRFAVRVPALGDRTISVEVKSIATRGEYASWRAPRAAGDFDLRTFEVRAYPVDEVAELRPGMSRSAIRGPITTTACAPAPIFSPIPSWRWMP